MQPVQSCPVHKTTESPAAMLRGSIPVFGDVALATAGAFGCAERSPVGDAVACLAKRQEMARMLIMGRCMSRDRLGEDR